MLVLSLDHGRSFYIGEDVHVRYLGRGKDDCARIGIEAPRDVQVHHHHVKRKIDEERGVHNFKMIRVVTINLDVDNCKVFSFERINHIDQAKAMVKMLSNQLINVFCDCQVYHKMTFKIEVKDSDNEEWQEYIDEKLKIRSTFS